MALYESVIIGRQDLTPGQFETLLEKFIAVIQSFKGEIKRRENWGIRNLAYKIKKNRKGHYMLLNIDGPPEAIKEYERLMRLDEDIIRFLTIKINSIDEKPSPLMANNSDRSKNEPPKDENLFGINLFVNAKNDGHKNMSARFSFGNFLLHSMILAGWVSSSCSMLCRPLRMSFLRNTGSLKSHSGSGLLVFTPFLYRSSI